MNKGKSDYLRGLLYFICLTICVCLFFKTPDGDTLLYELLGLFGISPGIPIGSSATLYIYMLAPGVGIIIFAIKTCKYWNNYRERFKEIRQILRLLPVFIIAFIYLAIYGLYPSIIERVYYAELSQRGGLRSVSLYAPDNPFQFKTDETGRTYSYAFTLANHGNETLRLNVELTHYDSVRLTNLPDLSDTLIKDEYGQPMVFTLQPKQRTRFIGEFTESQQTDNINGNGFSIALISGDERCEPQTLVEPARFVR